MPRSKDANEAIREQRRAWILASAAKVFARKGYAGTKVPDLAAAAQMSQGLLYRYFDGKEQVFAALVEQATQGIFLHARQALIGQGRAWDRLVAFTEQMLPYQYQYPEHALVVAHALTSEAVPQAIRAVALEHLGQLRLVIKTLIVLGQEAGAIVRRDPDQLTMLYLATLHGLAAAAAFFAGENASFPDATTMLLALQASPHIPKGDQ